MNYSYIIFKKYITSGSALKNSSMRDFKQNYRGEIKKHFFYIVQNGLNVLREGSIFIADRFQSFYYNLTFEFERLLRIIMILGIIFSCCSIGILIPIVFSVQKTNNKVLSLFGIMPINEIKFLSEKCEKFNALFLEEKAENSDDESK